jgi:hypothetical protein
VDSLGSEGAERRLSPTVVASVRPRTRWAAETVASADRHTTREERGCHSVGFSAECDSLEDRNTSPWPTESLRRAPDSDARSMHAEDVGAAAIRGWRPIRRRETHRSVADAAKKHRDFRGDIWWRLVDELTERIPRGCLGRRAGILSTAYCRNIRQIDLRSRDYRIHRFRYLRRIFTAEKSMPPTEKAVTRHGDPDESSAGDPAFPPCPTASRPKRGAASGKTVRARRTTASGRDPDHPACGRTPAAGN